jgi:hypothetical protein
MWNNMVDICVFVHVDTSVDWQMCKSQRDLASSQLTGYCQAFLRL